MKILLLNNNPVVNKLVTLSVQKTSDELSTAGSIEAIEPKDYDVLILDDALYSEDAMAEIKSIITYKESLYICAKDAKTADGFSKTLKKPFLPTDLVETLISLSKMVDTVELEKVCETHDFCELEEPHEKSESFDEIDDFESFEGLDELEDLDEIDEMADEKLELDEFEESKDDEGFEELDNVEDNESAIDGILDKEELQEVQNLLEETEMGLEDEELGEDFNFDENDLELEDLEETSEQENEEELGLDDSDLVLDEDLEIVDDVEPEEVLEKPKAQEGSHDELEDLASQIESAVQSLSDEDLQTEVDEDLLLNIGSLTSRDLKLAIGEDVDEEEMDEEEFDEVEVQHNEDEFEDELIEENEQVAVITDKKEQESGNDGVEALKKLLKALSNEDVAASLKGMKININITLGDK
ncbi:MAG: hypothetical protein QG565_1317 [Campylobacterota bacterium]|nr:hypothetical protein [Campylobacterota bacterium]MDQ1338007.1 putative rane protein [Campylobacterota bacterium]